MNTIEMMSNTVRTGNMFKSVNYSSIVAYDPAFGLCYVTDTKAYKDTVVCNEAFIQSKWEPYVKPVDWSKVPIDTKVMCHMRAHKDTQWYNRHFAFCINGNPRVWLGGSSSWTTSEVDGQWDEVKLAEE